MMFTDTQTNSITLPPSL